MKGKSTEFGAFIVDLKLDNDFQNCDPSSECIIKQLDWGTARKNAPDKDKTSQNILIEVSQQTN